MLISATGTGFKGIELGGKRILPTLLGSLQPTLEFTMSTEVSLCSPASLGAEASIYNCFSTITTDGELVMLDAFLKLDPIQELLFGLAALPGKTMSCTPLHHLASHLAGSNTSLGGFKTVRSNMWTRFTKCQQT